MTNEELKITITSLLANATFDEGGEWLNVNADAASWKAFAQQLRNENHLSFNEVSSQFGGESKTGCSQTGSGNRK